MRLKHVFVLILFFSIGLLEIGASPIYLRRLKGTVQHGGGRNAQMYI